jgi:inorganic triphosphatase YgiF
VPAKGGSLRAIYFDSPGRDLRRAGLSLRLRQEGGRWVQTVKAARPGGGAVLDRNEWEFGVPGPVLDLDAARRTALAPLLDADGIGDRIEPAFTVRAERRAFTIQRGGSLVELVIDQGEATHGGRSRRFAEVELELKHGDPAPLYRIACDLAEAAPLRLSLTTKSDRGYGLLTEGLPRSFKAELIGLEPGMTVAEAFQVIARSCLAQVLRNEAALRDGNDTAALHQMRVGLRRLRAALSLFKDRLDDDESRAIKAELRRTGRTLGAARDLDVLIERTRRTDPGARELLDGAERERAGAYEALQAMLSGSRYRRAILATAAWIETGRWLDAASASEVAARPIGEMAAAELAKRRRKVLKRARDLAALEPEARHRVRIATKKLRYGAEFFQSLFQGRKARKRRRAAVRDLEEMQDALGELNDLAVQDTRFGAAADGAAAGGPAGREDELLDRAGAASRRFAATKPFWR